MAACLAKEGGEREHAGGGEIDIAPDQGPRPAVQVAPRDPRIGVDALDRPAVLIASRRIDGGSSVADSKVNTSQPAPGALLWNDPPCQPPPNAPPLVWP